MNLLTNERKLLFSFIRRDLGSYSQNYVNYQSIHSKCWTKSNEKKLFSLKTGTNLLLKRDINFAKFRTYWRIITFKDKGIEDNFRVDRIDRKSNVLVYKAEMNRVCTLGGIVFPALVILFCIIMKLWPESSQSVDPHFKPNFAERHIADIMIIVSIFHISLSKRYVLRMYYNKRNQVFSASTWRWYLPFTTQKVECSAGAAKPVGYWFLGEGSSLGIYFGNCKINGKRLFINEENFTFPVYYNVLFGFSEPKVLNEVQTRPDTEDPTQEIQNLENLIRFKNKNN